MLTRRRVLVGKIEAVEGTAEAIVVGDAGIVAMDVKWSPDIKITKRSIQLNTLSNLAPVIGSRAGKVSFRAELKGSGGATYTTVGPAIAPYLKACGFAETLAIGSATYKPASVGIPTLTMWVYEDGIVKKLKGCRGNVKFSGKVGEPCYANFDFTGVYDAVADLVMISPTFEGTVPPPLLNAAFTVDAYAAVIDGFDIDMANSLELRPTANTVSGYLSTLLKSRDPSGKISPEMTTVATYDWYTKLLAGVGVALNIGPIGTGVCNKVQITAPKLVYTGVDEGDRVGNITAEVPFSLAMNTGDDEVSLIFAQ